MDFSILFYQLLATTLIVEEPYVKVLKQGINWDVQHCHFCLTSIDRGLPCPTCVFVSKIWKKNC